MPFANYKSFADCMAQNADKNDPGAYCSTIMRAVEKAEAEDRQRVAHFEIAKVDEDRRLVFGWANVAVRKDGQVITDSQGDRISPDVLEAAAYGYLLEDGDANRMHEPERIGRPVESFVATPEKLAKMGLASNALPTGWWIGMYVENDAAWEAVKKGELRMFSIEGTGEREPA